MFLVKSRNTVSSFNFMNIKKLYKTRFSESIRGRYLLWQILVKDFFQQYIEKKDIVLDIGCGYGEFINNIICQKKFSVDLNPESKKFMGKGVVFYRQSATNMKSVPDKSIDKIFVSNFFEHLNRPDIISTVKECRRVLKRC